MTEGRVEAIAAAGSAHHWIPKSDPARMRCACGSLFSDDPDHPAKEWIAADDAYLAEHPDEAPGPKLQQVGWLDKDYGILNLNTRWSRNVMWRPVYVKAEP